MIYQGNGVFPLECGDVSPPSWVVSERSGSDVGSYADEEKAALCRRTQSVPG